MSRPQATATVQISNERVIVTAWRFPPGSETGWHTHGHDHVVVPMTDGKLLLETPDGTRTAPLSPGPSYTRNEGIKHNVINPSGHEIVFVEIELR